MYGEMDIMRKEVVVVCFKWLLSYCVDWLQQTVRFVPIFRAQTTTNQQRQSLY
jgi:hypothetical protein